MLKENPALSSRTIKSIIQPYFRKRKKVTRADIYNTKVRCFWLINLYSEYNEYFEIFLSKFKSSKLSYSMDFIKDVSSDEAIQYRKIIWEEVLREFGNGHGYRSAIILSNDTEKRFKILSLFLQDLKNKSKDFEYRFAVNKNDKYNGIV